jgi:DNA-binding response OmpR family regulator
MTTVLIIEPDEATRELYQRELSRYYQVLGSSNADDTSELLQNKQIDIVVLEPALADGAGWRLLQDIHGGEPATAVPIVLCSALDERRRGLSLGAAAYLVKPVLPATLLNTLDHVLQG